MIQEQKLNTYLNTLESSIPKFITKNEKVSSSTVGWQIDHSLKVVNGVIGTLMNAPSNKPTKLTMLGRFCLWSGYIPRGKGKAPKVVIPPDDIKAEDLLKQVENARDLLNKLNTIDKTATFKHPFFGVLSKKQTIRFIEVHTNHHLKIINDILES